MEKIALILILTFSSATINSFAADKQTDKEKKEKKEAAIMKMAPGKSCSKKCADKEEKKADKKG